MFHSDQYTIIHLAKLDRVTEPFKVYGKLDGDMWRPRSWHNDIYTDMNQHTLLVKKVVTAPLKTLKPMWSNFCVSTWLKLAWYGPVIVPQRNPTLPWADIQSKVKWDRRAPKPKYRWSIPQNQSSHCDNFESIFAYFFQKFFWLFEQCPIQPLWVLGMKCLHLPVRALSKVLLLPVWVWLVLPSTTYSNCMLPLDLWSQANLQGLHERQHLGKAVHCWGWSDRIVSWVLGPWRRGWEICTEWGLVAQRLTTDSCPVVTGHIDPQRSPCWLPNTLVSAWSGRRGGGTWQWPTGSMSSSVMGRDSNFTR